MGARFGFILVDGYALMSTAAAVEPLRAANQLAGRTLYDVRFLSVDGGPVASSAGGWFETRPLAEADEGFDVVFVVAGGNPFAIRNAALTGHLRRLDRLGVSLGGISGGAAVLAQAGLMANRRFTVHWEHMETLRETVGHLLLERSLFVIDRDRLTCAGGVAPLDMMHAILTAAHGMDLARRVSDWFIHTRVRPPRDPQRAGTVEKYNVHHPSLVAAIELMDSHIADPLNLEQLADLSGLGARQFQRLFQRDLGETAMAFYRDLRLAKAEELLRQSALSVLDVGLATGFANPAHFARCFRARYGLSPSRHRGVGPRRDREDSRRAS